MNDQQIVLHSKQITWHQSFWTECWYLVTRRIFEHVLYLRWQLVYSHFHTAILCLFQTFIFRRKLPNLLMELWGLFYHSYFEKQGLNFTSYWQLINKIFSFMYYAIDFILILLMYEEFWGKPEDLHWGECGSFFLIHSFWFQHSCAFIVQCKPHTSFYAVNKFTMPH